MIKNISIIQSLNQAININYVNGILYLTHKNFIDEVPVNNLCRSDYGFLYEKYIGMYYEKLGYTVIYNGLNKGMFDGGIDLIVKNENEKFFLQCKYMLNSKIAKSKINNIMYNTSKLLIDEYKITNKKVNFLIIVPSKKQSLSLTRKSKNTYIAEEILNISNSTQQYIKGSFLEIPFELNDFNNI